MDEFQTAAISNQILNTLSDIRDNEELFDFTILVGDEEFRVHKFFLAACSEYFRGMLRHDSLETKNNQIRMHDISASTMKDVIDFCYTRKINLDFDKIQETLMGASVLQIKELVAMCEQYIKDRVETANCLGTLMVAERCSLNELYQYTFDYCLDSFEHIAKEAEFLAMDLDCLIKIISNDKLDMNDEYSIFDAIIRWIDHDKDNRLSKLEQLLNHVRFALMDPQKLVDLSSHKYIKDSPGCLLLLMHGKDYRMLETFPEKRSSMDDKKFQCRLPRRKQQCIFLVSNWLNPLESTLEKYDPYANKWLEVKQVAGKSNLAAVAILGDNLYLIGGFDGDTCLRSVKRYDILEDTWYDDVSKMTLERSHARAVSLDGYLYVIGGETPQAYPRPVLERYDPKLNRWTTCKSWYKGRSYGFGIAILNGLIYVIGGIERGYNIHLTELYNPETDTWWIADAMRFGRRNFGCVSFRGKIYAIGGRGDEGEGLESAECFDPETGLWTLLPSMSRGWGDIQLVTLDNLIYVVTCLSPDKRFNMVEAYDPMNRKWLERAPLLHKQIDSSLLPTLTEVLDSTSIVQHVFN